MVSKFRRICVFAGSSAGDDPAYSEAAIALGKLLAARKIGTVYGGAKVGLMGMLANAALVGGGTVIGVIPEKLQAREVAHTGLSELFVVDSMHARKTMMAHLADAFMVLPGGLGTLEETFEVATWTQLGYHAKPIGLLNVRGYFDPLLSFLDHAVQEGFVGQEHRRILHAAADPEMLLKTLEGTTVPEGMRWIDKP